MRPDPKASYAVAMIALGLVLAAGVAFAVDPAFFSRRVAWTAYFDATSQLDEGAPVYSHGTIAGRVTRLAWVPASRNYRVELRMDPDWQPPGDGGVRVEEWNPLRGTFISVLDGDACLARRPGPAGALTTCQRQAGLIEVSYGILGQVIEITTQVQGLMARYAPGAGGPDATGGAQLSGLSDLTGNVAALAASARVLVDQLVLLQPELKQTLVSATGLTTDASGMLRRTDVLLDALRRDTLVRVNHTLDGADALVRVNAGPLQASVADLRYIMGSSSSSIVRLVTQLEATTANLAELTRQLRDNPGVVLRGRTLDEPPGARAR